MFASLSPHDPSWAAAFATEKLALAKALGPDALEVHHFGSTAIPGILAKPILDILVACTCLQAVDTRNAQMQQLGYEALGAFGLPGRRYFRKLGVNGQRSHHVQIYATGTPVGITALRRHLAFRNYLRAHPHIASEYSALKANIIANGPVSTAAYCDAKDSFVSATERAALAWADRQPRVARLISLGQAMAIRHPVLRPDAPRCVVAVPGDAQAQHFGVFSCDVLVSTGSLFDTDNGAQFRKLATLPAFQGKGAGSLLLGHLIEAARARNAPRLWCNARLSARGFYENHGLHICSAFYVKDGIDYAQMAIKL